MEWLLMWALIATTLASIFSSVSAAYLHETGNDGTHGYGWLILTIMLSVLNVALLGGGLIYYFMKIYPIINGR